MRGPPPWGPAHAAAADIKAFVRFGAVGADEMVATARALGLRVFTHPSDIPRPGIAHEHNADG